jgi:hypothetical protein
MRRRTRWPARSLAVAACIAGTGCGLLSTYDFSGYFVEAGSVVEAGPDSTDEAHDGAADARDGGPVDSGACFEEALASDPHNCGRCGHDCLGGACADAACLPFTIAMSQAVCANDNYCGPWSLAVTATTAYWAELSTGPANGAVYASPLDGGATTPFASAQAYAVAIATDSTNVYWTSSPDLVLNRIYRCPTAGCGVGGPDSFSGDAGFYNPIAFAFTDASVYWTDTGYVADDGGLVPGNVWMEDKGGATLPQNVAPGESLPQGIVAADRLYWADNGTPPLYTDGTIVVADLDGGNRQVLASNQADPQSVALYNGQLYWTNFGTTAGNGTVWTCTPTTPTKCASTATEFGSGQAEPYALAVDPSGIYWTVEDGFYVWRCPLPVPCMSQRITPPQGAPWALALDPVSVFWTDVATDREVVLRMAKP